MREHEAEKAWDSFAFETGIEKCFWYHYYQACARTHKTILIVSKEIKINLKGSYPFWPPQANTSPSLVGTFAPTWKVWSHPQIPRCDDAPQCSCIAWSWTLGKFQVNWSKAVSFSSLGPPRGISTPPRTGRKEKCKSGQCASSLSGVWWTMKWHWQGARSKRVWHCHAASSSFAKPDPPSWKLPSFAVVSLPCSFFWNSTSPWVGKSMWRAGKSSKSPASHVWEASPPTFDALPCTRPIHGQRPRRLTLWGQHVQPSPPDGGNCRTPWRSGVELSSEPKLTEPSLRLLYPPATHELDHLWTWLAWPLISSLWSSGKSWSPSWR